MNKVMVVDTEAATAVVTEVVMAAVPPQLLR